MSNSTIEWRRVENCSIEDVKRPTINFNPSMVYFFLRDRRVLSRLCLENIREYLQWLQRSGWQRCAFFRCVIRRSSQDLGNRGSWTSVGRRYAACFDDMSPQIKWGRFRGLRWAAIHAEGALELSWWWSGRRRDPRIVHFQEMCSRLYRIYCSMKGPTNSH